MNRMLLFTFTSLLPLCSDAHTISFEDDSCCRAIGVYDTWEQSPFRTGKLEGNALVTNNFLKNGNSSSRILGVQRSRFGSNTFGVRIDLNTPFVISPETLYVHIKIHKPVAGKVMLIGLGKRTERAAQSPETEQFWQYSENKIVPGIWNDAVFAVRGSDGTAIHSLVVVPDCRSPHGMTADFAAYIDDIEITNDAEPRIDIADKGGESVLDADASVVLNAAGRNGYITGGDGRHIVSCRLPRNKAFEIKAVPAPGFVLDAIIVKGRTLEKRVEASLFDDGGCFTIPAEWMTEDLTVEGLFKSIDNISDL